MPNKNKLLYFIALKLENVKSDPSLINGERKIMLFTNIFVV